MGECRPLSDDGEYLCYVDEVQEISARADKRLITEAARTPEGREFIAAELRELGWTVTPPGTDG